MLIQKVIDLISISYQHVAVFISRFGSAILSTVIYGLMLEVGFNC